jgi:uroporphyrinogen-III synthase
LDYASELAEIITLIYNKESYTFKRNLRNLARSIKSAGITFNEIEVYETKLAPFKISDKNFDGICFLSAVESYLTNNKIKKEVCFA